MEKRTPLHTAAGNGALRDVESLLSEEHDIHAPDRRGLTPLHIAAEWGQEAAARLLLERGAGPNYAARSPIPWAFRDNWTAFHVAAEGGEPAMVQLLLDFGADIRDERAREQRDFFPPLALAIRKLISMESMRATGQAFEINEDTGEETPIPFDEAVRPYLEVMELLKRHEAM
jgi:hypothetical protein